MTIDHAAFEGDQNSFFNYTFKGSWEPGYCLFNPDHKKIKLFKKNRATVSRCECGFVFESIQPTKELLYKFYAKSKAMNTWARHKQGRDEDLRQRSKYDRAVAWITKQNIKSVLDVGCGTGRFLSMLPEGINKLGIDSNEASLSVARSLGVPVQRTEIIPTDKKFDLISLWGVFEHVKDPIELAKRCYSALNPGGYLLICVPNLDSFVVHTLWEKCSTFCPQHLWYFNEQTLTRALNRANFEPELTYTIEPEALPIAKYKLGFEPYRKDITGVFLDKVAELAETIQELGEHTNNGYKIVGVFKRA